MRMTLTSRMQRWSAGSLAVGLLQSSRGRSMETARVQCGPKSSTARATRQFSWIVTASLETPALLAKLLDSPAQVEEELQFDMSFYFNKPFYSL
ncbi:hypothetical protein EYF80_063748 [Liparis tanakae]|uniref:Uncharacterized protein n=1 Tax=Liparis tanakae TaxID=230148 RepID=A0A4Z2EBI8_9TELE|nr:hypothetical protein EYF80_063748 [Liparis tanakae]